ncbi:MAG: hypothetical protein HON65_07635 [Rhodospirillales bacterium]|jgi:uncharacterized protein|nr:hypothetical protein [Rhodospirillales bacterium]
MTTKDDDDNAIIEDALSKADSNILPDVIPIFPLSDVLLLPCAKLPLNIFEPRYLEMVDYALAHNRLIGIIQPRQSGEEKNTEEPDVYDMGCLGRIINFSEIGDGRYAITLLGLSRFTIQSELPVSENFRLANVDYETFIEDLNDSKISVAQRDDLLKTVRVYLSANEIDADWETIEDAADYALITSLSMLCPFSAGEKQALLECDNILDRTHLLSNLMTLSLHDTDAADQGAIH